MDLFFYKDWQCHYLLQLLDLLFISLLKNKNQLQGIEVSINHDLITDNESSQHLRHHIRTQQDISNSVCQPLSLLDQQAPWILCLSEASYSPNHCNSAVLSVCLPPALSQSLTILLYRICIALFSLYLLPLTSGMPYYLEPFLILWTLCLVLWVLLPNHSNLTFFQVRLLFSVHIFSRNHLILILCSIYDWSLCQVFPNLYPKCCKFQISIVICFLKIFTRIIHWDSTNLSKMNFIIIFLHPPKKKTCFPKYFWSYEVIDFAKKRS